MESINHILILVLYVGLIIYPTYLIFSWCSRLIKTARIKRERLKKILLIPVETWLEKGIEKLATHSDAMGQITFKWRGPHTHKTSFGDAHTTTRYYDGVYLILMGDNCDRDEISYVGLYSNVNVEDIPNLVEALRLQSL